MAKIPSVDTNVLLRALLADVPAQTAVARKVLTQCESVEIADLAITEAVFVLEKVLDVSRRDIAKLLGSLLANQHINCNRALFEKVLAVYPDHPACSFNDLCLATYAQLQNATPLYTFDKKLATQVKAAELLR